MKITIALIFVIALIAIVFLLACKPKGDHPNHANYLVEGPELAQQLGGLYFGKGNVTVVNDLDNRLERFQLTLANGDIIRHTINIFLEKGQRQKFKITSGEYEVLYLKQILILNKPETDLKYTFKVQSDGLEKLETRLPEGYMSSPAIEAVGIAFGGPLLNLKGNPQLLTGQSHSAGGPGAPTCSNACCTITCKNGYYATCGRYCNCTKEE